MQRIKIIKEYSLQSQNINEENVIDFKAALKKFTEDVNTAIVSRRKFPFFA